MFTNLGTQYQLKKVSKTSPSSKPKQDEDTSQSKQTQKQTGEWTMSYHIYLAVRLDFNLTKQSQNLHPSSKNLHPSYKMDVDFRNCFRRENQSYRWING